MGELPFVQLVDKIGRALNRRLRAALAVAKARRTTQRRLQGPPIRRVVVVCYGNIYRSPFVGECLRQQLGPMVEVRTVGFHSVTGRSSPPRHIEMCRRRSISLVEHRSNLITQADLAWADTIVFMDRHNWDALDAMSADRSKLVWLGALSDGNVEIPDPYGMDESAAEQVLSRLESTASALAAAIKAQTSSSK